MTASLTSHMTCVMNGHSQNPRPELGPRPPPCLTQRGQVRFLLWSVSAGTTWGQATQHQPLVPSGFDQTRAASGWAPLLSADNQDEPLTSSPAGSLFSQDVTVTAPQDLCGPYVLCPEHPRSLLA